MYAVNAPTYGIHHAEEKCKLNVDGQTIGEGTLYITADQVTWITADGDGQGINLEYREMAVHALSTDSQAFPDDCLYVMYNQSILDEHEGSDGGDDASSSISEVRFVPQDKDNLKKMYEAMSDCQCLHPDDEDSDCFDENAIVMDSENLPPSLFEGGAAGEGFYTGEDALPNMTPQGLATMHRLEAMLASSQAPEPTGDTAAGDAALPREMRELHLNNGHGLASDGEDEDDVEGQFDDA